MVFLRVICLSAIGFAAAAQNASISVSNAAGSTGFPTNSLAPGSIVNIQIVQGGPVVVNPDPSKTTVAITPQNGSAVNATVVRVSIGSVWALLPKDLPLGSAQVSMTNEVQSYPAVRVSIVPVAVGVFALDAIGLGTALAQNDSPNGTIAQNRLTSPAVPGDYLTLWATGLGQAAISDVSVEVGGVPVTPTYAGPSPGYPGVDQINLQLPVAAPDGCYVSLRVKAQASVSNEVSIAKASSAGSCAHPYHLSLSELQALDSGQTVRFNTATIRSSVEPPFSAGLPQNTYTRNESAMVQVFQSSATDIALQAQTQKLDEAYFGCSFSGSFSIARLIGGVGSDAGSPFTLLGPGKSISLASNGSPFYNSNLTAPDPVADPAQLPAAFFVPGGWQLTGPGGRDLGPFQTSLTLPPPIRLTNRTALAAIDRTVDQTVTWQADGYTSGVVMTVTLSSGLFGQSLPGLAVAAGVSCRAPASSGKLTIPAAFLKQIPASAPASTPAGTLALMLQRRPESQVRFEIPVVSGGSAHGVFTYTFGETLRTNIR